MDVGFVNTTFRDGHQSLWASGIRSGMMAAVAEDMERAGFDVIEVPVGPNFMKKFVRDLKENPFDIARMLASKMPNTAKSSMGGNIMGLEPSPPRAIIELFYAHLVGIGALNRVQVTCNTLDQIKCALPWIVPLFRGLGLQIALALSYSISPRHTDEYYAQKTRELLPFKPDAIYLKDQGGLLTVDRARTLLPIMVRNAGGVPMELHSHCTTGLAPLVYLEALQLGVRTLHTAIPPLANGSSQPSVLNVAMNAQLMGYSTRIDEKIIRSIAERLTTFAKQDGLPIGVPLEYDAAQYIHQVPGGVISNLKHNLAELNIQHRMDEVFEEAVQVRKDLGYPIMITPFSQYVVTQSALNVVTGERYKLVIDEVILLALGSFGEDCGYTWMDQNLKDKLLSLPRAKELAARKNRDIPIAEIREKLGGAGVSDEELLLRYIMKGEQEIATMRAAGPPKQYLGATMPLQTLLQELGKHHGVRYVHVQKGGASLVMQG